jgi:hypothetical protein
MSFSWEGVTLNFIFGFRARIQGPEPVCGKSGKIFSGFPRGDKPTSKTGANGGSVPSGQPSGPNSIGVVICN